MQSRLLAAAGLLALSALPAEVSSQPVCAAVRLLGRRRHHHHVERRQGAHPLPRQVQRQRRGFEPRPDAALRQRQLQFRASEQLQPQQRRGVRDLVRADPPCRRQHRGQRPRQQHQRAGVGHHLGDARGQHQGQRAVDLDPGAGHRASARRDLAQPEVIARVSPVYEPGIARRIRAVRFAFLPCPEVGRPSAPCSPVAAASSASLPPNGEAGGRDAHSAKTAGRLGGHAGGWPMGASGARAQADWPSQAGQGDRALSAGRRRRHHGAHRLPEARRDVGQAVRHRQPRRRRRHDRRGGRGQGRSRRLHHHA